jgi:hypothetical protein
MSLQPSSKIYYSELIYTKPRDKKAGMTKALWNYIKKDTKVAYPRDGYYGDDGLDTAPKLSHYTTDDFYDYDIGAYKEAMKEDDKAIVEAQQNGFKMGDKVKLRRATLNLVRGTEGTITAFGKATKAFRGPTALVSIKGWTGEFWTEVVLLSNLELVVPPPVMAEDNTILAWEEK